MQKARDKLERSHVLPHVRGHARVLFHGTWWRSRRRRVTFWTSQMLKKLLKVAPLNALMNVSLICSSF